MKSKEVQSKRVFVIRLERGENVVSSISNFCKENKIEGGVIQGIGTFSYAKIYSVKDNEKFVFYEEGATEVSEPMELVSALGNVATKDGAPLIHIHVCLALPDNSTKSGHLLEGKVSFAGEFFIFETDKLLKKKEGDLNQFQL